jgi:hypothetical protein
MPDSLLISLLLSEPTELEQSIELSGNALNPPYTRDIHFVS